MWMIAILAFGTIVAGPIGFIIGLIIIGFMVYSKEQSLNQNNEPSEPHEPFHKQEQHSNPSTIRLLTPCIEMVCHFALKYEHQWTTEKVKYVKSVFQECCDNAEDETYLREVLKTKHRSSLETCIHQWLELNPNQESKEVMFTVVCRLLVNTCQDIEKIRYDGFGFGTTLGLSYQYCHSELEAMLEDAFQYESQHNSTGKSELETAAEILGVGIQATEQEINKAYRIKMKDYHPDRNVNVTPAVQRMLEEQTQLLNNARDFMLKYIN
ncbi:J domain-containing protein [Acinetobacter chinensis]|uniref:J domain-containing protein n=1 Tax=Acinetobacter chinensis TaxID=2004650 RepID=A0A3B7M103_9GAMM|nr:J domain-containing protein [Acinetobacter chinensis]AXY58271.1 J domain-containing protein [Acinetobacter chinensis]MDV2470539.1 DnaJ domain-containing protein [Acinetobacter chinensis]